MPIRFSPCQAKALHLLESDANVFLTGSAGTGKSELLRQYLKGKGRQRYPVLASTGVAAILVDGRTFHSFFSLGICEGGRKATVARALKSHRLKSRLERAGCIVIDEVSMLSGEVFATAEEIARLARGNEAPWGGLRIIAVGDFAQLPPVQPEANVKDWAFHHPVWEHTQFVPTFLQTTMRMTEPRFLRVLRDVREGIVSDEVCTFLDERRTSDNARFDGTHLFPHRASADRHNAARLQRIEQPLWSFETYYKGAKMSLEQLQRQCPIPKVLHLKKDALVMLRKNDTSFPYDYVNGSLGVITGSEEGVLHIRLLEGKDIAITRQTFSLLDGDGNERAAAYNFPVTLAWATTIHKAQGASIDRLMINISGLWESGHAYVALSRARSEKGLFIAEWDPESIFVDPAVQTFYQKVRTQWETLAASLSSEPPEITEQRDVRPERIPNHERTHALVHEKKSLSEIAAVLEWKEETIVGHIDRLIREGKELDIQYLRPDQGIFQPIAKAFAEHGMEKLKPVYDALGEKFSYKDIRLVGLFLDPYKKESCI